MTTLQEVKDHLRLTGTAEDPLLSVYLGAAIEYVRAYTRQPWPDNEDAPFSVQAAVLLLVADLYENREAQATAALHENRTVDRLLWPYRVF